MMNRKLILTGKFILSLLLPFVLLRAFAEPPKEVIQSCHRGKALWPGVKLTELMGEYCYKKHLACDDGKRYYIRVNKTYFFTDQCHNGPYFVAGTRKIKFTNSINKSRSPDIEPYGLSSVPTWHLIQFKNKRYICMESSLGDNGWAAAVGQYYLVENAFNTDKSLQIYFYFFDEKFIDKVRKRGWSNG